MTSPNPAQTNLELQAKAEACGLSALPRELSSGLLAARASLKEKRPLIHCITNPISINDCANAILAVGGRPIMAEHPLEAEAITETAQALSLNLGNITDARMESMRLSGKQARSLPIPAVLDAVGVACSPLRLKYARSLIRECQPSIVKGNISELLALCGAEAHPIGIDAGKQDAVSPETRGAALSFFSAFSREQGCVIFCTGREDFILDGTGANEKRPYRAAVLQNGCEALSWITGTGCMAGALTAAFSAVSNPFEACILAAATMGIAGEKAAMGAKGPGSFRAELLDALFYLSGQEQEFCSSLRLGLYEKQLIVGEQKDGWELTAFTPGFRP